MRDNLTCHISKLIVATLLCLSIGPVQGQEQISGVINSYAKVNFVGPGYVDIPPLQAGQFTPGDYVLLIQMQGVGIQTTQGSYGIYIQSVFGTPGGYEILVVQSVNTGTGRVTFTRNVYINNYDIAGNVQLVRIPYYNSPTVTGTLGSQPWNSTTGTGGIVALMAGRRLTLNADIDVSGQGFAGAAGVDGIGECVNLNVTLNDHDSYPLTWNNAGLKGEGVAIHNSAKVLLYPNHAKGQGQNFTGGGGGNGRYSGGGGGSNRGKGADGEPENGAQCSNDPRDGGRGGLNIYGTVIDDGIFAGGGGGASTRAAGFTASAGGNGGGIIVIIADTIEGNNHFIRSDGLTAANSGSNAGAGGAGAGGSVAVFFRELSGQIGTSSDGGDGGISPDPYGNGGGGGGGLVWLSSSAIPASITTASVASGTPEPTIPVEGIGEIKYDYSPSLNGFLFNSVWSVATGNRIDYVCSDVMYGRITGTRPVGGIPPYTYRWESSVTSESSGFTTAPGTNNLPYYTPPVLLTQTTWFRRVVTDNGAAITDISLPVQVQVHPYIKNNIIGDQDTLCYGQDPELLGSRATLQDGNGIYAFNWETSTDNVTYGDVSVTEEDYLPPAGLTLTTWYRRTVNSGSCVNTSAPVRITVLEPISSNSIINSAQEICDGMSFANLDGTVAPALAGGDDTYRFRWERSTDGTNWLTAAGVTSQANYDPEEASPSFPGQEYFRRVVFSGDGNVCVSMSGPVLLSVYPVITNNSVIPGDQIICSGTVPAELTGSTPLNGKGAGSYVFTWQDSTKNHTWADIQGYIAVPGLNFISPPLTDTTRYRRITYSSACSNISNSVIINVHSPVTNNNISLLGGQPADTTICAGAIPNRFTGTIPAGGTNIPGDYAFQWSLSVDNSAYTTISTAATGQFYQPSAALTATTWFRRRVTSGQCFTESSPVKVTVLPVISNNTISGGQPVCKDETPLPLTQISGVTLSGGGGPGSYSFLWEESRNGTAWVPATGTNNSSNGNYQPPVMTRTMKYRRNVSSGANNCCTGVSNVLDLVLDSLPPGSSIDAGPDTIIYSFDRIIQMAADPALEGGTGHWSVTEGSGSIQDEADNNTKVTGISLGLNRFLWTVTRGACKLEDMVDVTIYELVIPEGFSPNGDPEGFNNTFIVKGLDLPNQVAELVIINGAGTEVFTTTNRNGNEWSDWDGKNSKGIDLPEGTYYYLLKITSNGNSQVFKKSGFIVLKRF